VSAVLAIAAALHASVFAFAATPDYQLGDVAVADVITPVPLLVVNPEATEGLRRKLAEPVLLIVRYNPQRANDAEAELRSVVTQARRHFLAFIQEELLGRAPTEADRGSPAYTRAIAEVTRESRRDLPVAQLASLWVLGIPDETFLVTLVEPLREVMSTPIVGDDQAAGLSSHKEVRVVPVRSLLAPPRAKDIEAAGQNLPREKIITRDHAQWLLENRLGSHDAGLGKFAAAFVRENAAPDPGTTELLRAQQTGGITATDEYAAAQIVVHAGQTIDRKALNALAVMREKTLISTLQNQLEQPTVAISKMERQTTWILAGVAGVFLLLIAVLWRLRARPSKSLIALATEHPFERAESATFSNNAPDPVWRKRALAAEAKAARAHEAIRAGVLGWMREKIVQALSSQRTQLLLVQHKAEAEMRELEQRLDQLHAPLQERMLAYEKRIQELESALADKQEETRHLITAQLALARRKLSADRFRYEVN